MPAGDDHEERTARRLPIALFWTGLALTPLAALILFVNGGDGGLRIALVLATLAVVLIGLSVALRRDAEAVRGDLEETLLGEIDMVREDVRRDIATAARAQHHQFSEKLQALYESVEALRGQLDATRAGYPPPDLHPAGPAPAGQHSSGRVYGGGPRGHAGPSGPPVVPGGVVRHTETVQVTTRHTIVDPHADGDSGRGTVYGSGALYGSPASEGRGRHASAAGRDWSEVREWPEPAEESWTEQRLRERFGTRGADSREPRGHDSRAADPRGHDSRAADLRGHDSRAADLRGTPDLRTDGFLDPPGGAGRRRYDRDVDDPGDDERWSGMRAGDRWASVRSDDRGRELRMGERRAAMHSDETGTELRFEDRWASVRRDEPRRGWADDRWSEDRWGPGVEETGRWDDGPQPGGLAALPAASSEPSWDAWGRQSDSGYDWAEEPPRAHQRGLGFEFTDDRWR